LITRYLFRTDEKDRRWEIRFLEGGTTEYRLEGGTGWLAGWPPSLPLLKDDEE